MNSVHARWRAVSVSASLAGTLRRGCLFSPAMRIIPGRANCRKAISLLAGPPGRQNTGFPSHIPKATPFPGPMRTWWNIFFHPSPSSTPTTRSRSLPHAPPLVRMTSTDGRDLSSFLSMAFLIVLHHSQCVRKVKRAQPGAHGDQIAGVELARAKGLPGDDYFITDTQQRNPGPTVDPGVTDSGSRRQSQDTREGAALPSLRLPLPPLFLLLCEGHCARVPHQP